MDALPEITPINCYNVGRGKLSASVRWLIGCVYGSSPPDLLLNPIRDNDNNTFQLETVVVTALANASLYSSAAAKIFHDQSLINQPHGVVLRALASHSIAVMILGEDPNITEGMLVTVQPFQQDAHLAVMDALMAAHMRSIISIERVVEAVQNYTTVDKREEPMDGVDALMFWINKICLLVRDDLEKRQARNKDPNQYGAVVVPEMDDLYEDMCDGACVCALVAFYRPKQMHMEEICFNDPMSVPDCQYNLMMLKRFCTTLPQCRFHFEVEDILYLHESLQPNVNAFLADLFLTFEGNTSSQITSPVDPTPSRRFVPIQGIPDLRSPQQRPVPPRLKYIQSQVPRTMSAMSADSLMTTRSGDSLRYNVARSRATMNGAETTNFGQLVQDTYEDRNGTGGEGMPQSQGGNYSRSDSMPAASIRLALEEKRREHEKKRYIDRNSSECERAQKQKDAFFALMQRVQKQGGDAKGRTMSEMGGGVPSDKEIRNLKETVQGLKQQLHEMSLQQEHLSRQVVDGQRQMSHAISQPAIHSEYLYMQEGSQAAPNPYATLPHNMAKAALEHHQQPQHQHQQHTYAMPYNTQMDPAMMGAQALYQPSNQQIAMAQQQQQMQLDAYNNQLATSPPQLLGGSPMAVNGSPYGMSSSFILHQQQQPVLSPPVVSSAFTMSQGVPYASSMSDVNTNTFRLHQNNASSSRLDPPLELKHNLTNWGLTYKAGHMSRPQRRTWENGTFIKSEMDLVNQPDIVPHAPTEQDQMRPMPGSSMSSGGMMQAPPQFYQQANDENIYEPQRQNDQQPLRRSVDEQETRPPPPAHQPSPPKDPTSPTPSGSLVTQRRSISGGSQFIVEDALPDEDVVGVTREMQARRDALLANILKRREQTGQKVEETQAKHAERRQAELEKQEAAEQKKREREMQRQKILEDYKRKKMERDLEAMGSQSGRGHSQPPTPSRPKSSIEYARSRTMNRSVTRPQSSVDDGSAQSSARITVPSTAEPALKLFSKYVHKSNRSMIINALQFSVFPGAVSDKMRNEVLGELAKSDSKHFLLLFRDQKCRFMGAYSWDQQSDTAHRIHGRGPNVCSESMMQFMFKYDSGSKSFTNIPSKHLSATIDGFTLQDHLVQNSRIPHSGSVPK